MKAIGGLVSSAVTAGIIAGSWAQPCVVAEMQKLLDSAGVSSHEFGYAVTASGDEIVAGSPSMGVFSFTNSGSGWTENEIIDPLEVVTGTGFGSSLALDNDVLLVGTPCKTASGTESGSVFVFRKTTFWAVEAQLEPTDPADFDHFGLSVAIAGDVAVVGAGRMGPDQEFGDGVAIDAATGMVFVGAPGNSTIEQLAGAVYVFEPSGPSGPG